MVAESASDVLWDMHKQEEHVSDEGADVGRRVRVLVADDSSLTRGMIGRMLEGYQCCEVVGVATDGEQALSRATELKPDLILMDVSMPRLNGLEATRRLRLGGDNRTRVLIVTFDSETAQAAVNHGLHADGVCNKLHLQDELYPALVRMFPWVGRQNGPAANPH